MKRKGLGQRLFGRALRDERGGIVVTAAMSMLPITLLAFAAVEFHNFTTQRSALQDALDSAALAVARAPTSATQAQLRTLYVAVLKSHLQLKPGLVELVEAQPDPLTGAGGKPELTYANGRVTANATLKISPIVASFFIRGDVLVSGASQVLREAKGLEVALVLDNTYSMLTNNRIGITKTAAKEFVDTLGAVAGGSTTPNAVRIGLVPFQATVNVGARYATSTWMDLNAQSPIHDDIFTTSTGDPTTANRFTLLNGMGITWGGCVESRPYPHDVSDTAPSAAAPATLFVPYFAPDEMDYLPAGRAAQLNNEWAGQTVQPFPYPNTYLPELDIAIANFDRQNSFSGSLGDYWNGFEIDFRRDYKTEFLTHTKTYRGVQGVAQKYTSTYAVNHLNAEVAAGRFSRTSTTKGPNRGCQVKPLMRLSTDYPAVKTAIDAMTPDGSTNIPMGLAWGWHLLSPVAPFSDGTPYRTAGVTKIAVLMTDGENSLTTDIGSHADNLNGSEYTGVGYVWQNRIGTTSGDWTTRRNAMDARLTELCTNMKARGVLIYTIRVEVTGGSPDVLRNCASSPQMFFDVTQASQLTGAFRNIARSIQNLRIAA